MDFPIPPSLWWNTDTIFDMVQDHRSGWNVLSKLLHTTPMYSGAGRHMNSGASNFVASWSLSCMSHFPHSSSDPIHSTLCIEYETVFQFCRSRLIDMVYEAEMQISCHIWATLWNIEQRISPNQNESREHEQWWEQWSEDPAAGCWQLVSEASTPSLLLK